MPVILELEEYEADLVVEARVEMRIRLMKDWEGRYRSPDDNDSRYGVDIEKVGDLAMIDANIDTVYALRERLKDGIMVQRMCQEHALHPNLRGRCSRSRKQLRALLKNLPDHCDIDTVCIDLNPFEHKEVRDLQE
ncbi:hypothetical protein GUK30_28365 [Rhizobium leguminosarum]|uniref:hypothetical protein n=1 Tax=Rhizobium TaxID=379 RepID=UPI0003749AD9|nr:MULTISPECIES: hypothetical protein [Rhizobium]MBY5854036.1 hypothetical protein [Rhizobium leguminosarum]NEI23301.1 hypothetical protein [Rhizobium ruizarguesonis]NEI29350.1 hypothetical protein [Rhizobium ruizarguesonis]TBY36425.1 hypothetical protein E0H60_22675 [Rhizobium leguminosarum bv. viciae]TBY73902.1 hypothetical protein E0H51_22025 [Rhizobium leguminosarum bv. viciae]